MEVEAKNVSSNLDIGGLRDQRVQFRCSPPIVCSRVCLIRLSPHVYLVYENEKTDVAVTVPTRKRTVWITPTANNLDGTCVHRLDGDRLSYNAIRTSSRARTLPPSCLCSTSCHSSPWSTSPYPSPCSTSPCSTSPAGRPRARLSISSLSASSQMSERA
jgi:hypothetical protein